jgi:hypothetical protein
LAAKALNAHEVLLIALDGFGADADQTGGLGQFHQCWGIAHGISMNAQRAIQRVARGQEVDWGAGSWPGPQMKTPGCADLAPGERTRDFGKLHETTDPR